MGQVMSTSAAADLAHIRDGDMLHSSLERTKKKETPDLRIHDIIEDTLTNRRGHGERVHLNSGHGELL
eukprot:3191680-Rhodomonas_salina.5